MCSISTRAASVNERLHHFNPSDQSLRHFQSSHGDREPLFLPIGGALETVSPPLSVPDRDTLGSRGQQRHLWETSSWSGPFSLRNQLVTKPGSTVPRVLPAARHVVHTTQRFTDRCFLRLIRGSFYRVPILVGIILPCPHDTKIPVIVWTNHVSTSPKSLRTNHLARISQIPDRDRGGPTVDSL